MFILPIKSRADFVNIQKKGDHTCHAPAVILIRKKTPDRVLHRKDGTRDEFVRIGVVASRRFCKRAVVRNFARRRVREAFREVVREGLAEPFTDYEFIVRSKMVKGSFSSILEDVRLCMKKEAEEGSPLPSLKKRKNKNVKKHQLRLIRK